MSRKVTGPFSDFSPSKAPRPGENQRRFVRVWVHSNHASDLRSPLAQIDKIFGVFALAAPINDS